MDEDLKKLIDETVDCFFNNTPEKLHEASFRIYNNTLCPDLWDEYQHLDPEVRLNLLRMAYDLYKKTKFVAPIADVWLMGSIANYNWTPDSDADVHIIIDFSKLQMPNETASKVAKSAGAQWNNEHNVTIKGHKVEINIQSVKAEKPYVMGIYSLVKDAWVRQPQHMNVNIDKTLIQAKYGEMKKYVEDALQSKDQEVLKSAKEYLDDYRQHGLDTGGELSVENIVYKILRSKGLIKMLKSSIVSNYDQEMTVSEKTKPSLKETNGPHDIDGANFKIRFNQDGIGSNAAKVFIGDEWFANAYQPWGEGDWAINAHTGAMKRHFKSPERLFKTLEELLEYLETWYSTNSVREVTQKDIKSKFPLPSAFSKGDPKLSMMTLDNLKSMRDKEARMWKALQGKEDKQGLQQAVDGFIMYNDEIKRRMDYINAPANEQFVHSFEADYGRGKMYVEVFKNPTTREFNECKPHYEVGALLKDNDIYVFNREKAYHKNVMTQMKLEDAMSILIMPDNTSATRMDILVTDATKNTKWHHNPNTEQFIRSHPFFKRKQIDHIMYWDEDIVGDWSKLKPEVSEGYGMANPEQDPLHVPGERWRIKWGSRKTPKISADEQKIVNELVDDIVAGML